MRYKEQIFPFVKKYSRADGQGSWKNNDLSIGIEKLNQYVSSVTAVEKKSKQIIITTSENIGVKDIITKKISFSSSPTYKTSSGKLKLEFPTSSGISNSMWYVERLLLGGKFELTSNYSAQNDYGVTVTFKGKQIYKMSDHERAQAAEKLSDLTNGTEDPTQYSDDDLLSRINSLLSVGSGDGDSEEKASGINWWLVAGLIAVVVIVYLIIKK